MALNASPSGSPNNAQAFNASAAETPKEKSAATEKSLTGNDSDNAERAKAVMNAMRASFGGF